MMLHKLALSAKSTTFRAMTDRCRALESVLNLTSSFHRRSPMISEFSHRQPIWRQSLTLWLPKGVLWFCTGQNIFWGGTGNTPLLPPTRLWHLFTPSPVHRPLPQKRQNTSTRNVNQKLMEIKKKKKRLCVRLLEMISTTCTCENTQIAKHTQRTTVFSLLKVSCKSNHKWFFVCVQLHQSSTFAGKELRLLPDRKAQISQLSCCWTKA